MLQFHGKTGGPSAGALTRRDFLRVGSLGAGAFGLTLADLHRVSASTVDKDVNCILLFLVGGPSQLDTWDLKPNAPDTIRGPFKPIRTNVPGIDLCEHFPRMAQMAERFAVLRSVHHTSAPIHETGHQLMQTGYLSRNGFEHPHYGSVLSHLRGSRRNGTPPFVVLPAPIGNTGVSVSHGQAAGYLGTPHEPLTLGNEERFSGQATKAFDLTSETDELRGRYGRNSFGQSCLLARRLIEQGTRLVTVNMFESVFNQVTWDCHADGGALGSSLEDYKQTLCPMFDLAYTALLEDLRQRGLLDTTLVVAMGEFGRTPQLNPRGGRDHWPGVWSILFAGAGVRGGQVIGASDRNGAEPHDRPITPEMVAASVYQGLGIDLRTCLAGPNNEYMPLVAAEPIGELFGG